MTRSILAALCAVAAGTAIAATTTMAPFKAIDANADGYISAEEAKAVEGLAAQFEQADRNKDGRLDRKEYEGLTASTLERAPAPSEGR